MNTTDLMIGDWILIPDHQDAPATIPARVTMINDCNALTVFLDGGDCIFNGEEVGPISLTPEILEKNRFENIPYAGIDCNKIWLLHETSYYGKSFPLYTDDIMLGYNMSEQCWCIFFNIGGVHSDFRTVTTIFYVHELQHVLKLCGIEKEIIL